MASTDDDEYGCSSGDEAALLQASQDPTSSKRKLPSADEDSSVINSIKRQRTEYPATSELASRILKERFGLEKFRLEQEAAISRVIDGGSSVVILPTGGGKSLCYQVPALAFTEKDAEDGSRHPSDAGVTIVVSPLIALMKDQVDALRKRGIYAVAFDSTKSREEFLQMNADLRDGKIRLLYCAPERLNNEGFVGSIKHVRGGVRLVAIDEAHCVSEWGHSFRPDYLKVARFVKEINAERVLCLTATATPAVAEDICKSFDIDSAGMFRTAMYRPNLRLLVKVTKTIKQKLPLLEKFLKDHPGPTIVYVTTQKQSEELATTLSSSGFESTSFHAGMKTEEKSKVQDKFLKSKNMIICCTIAFGMGIDKPDIRNIIHYDFPSSIESYSQQIGRGGRDGLLTQCMFYLCPEDFYQRDVFVFGSTPSVQSIGRFLDDICSPSNMSLQIGETFEVSHFTQGKEFDIRPTSLSIIYAQLELHFGLIRAIAPRYSDYSYEPGPQFSSSYADRSIAATTIHRVAQKKIKWYHIGVDQAARSAGISRIDIVLKLNAWNDKNIISMKTSGLQHVYRIEKALPEGHERQVIANTLFAQMHKRENQDMERTKDVQRLVTDTSCISRGLAKYFGDLSNSDTECGHCSWCETHEAPVIPDRPVFDDTKGVGKILEAFFERDDPRFLARIAFGIPSPRITAAKYSSSPLFGSLQGGDFPALLRIFTAACEP